VSEGEDRRDNNPTSTKGQQARGTPKADAGGKKKQTENRRKQEKGAEQRGEAMSRLIKNRGGSASSTGLTNGWPASSEHGIKEGWSASEEAVATRVTPYAPGGPG